MAEIIPAILSNDVSDFRKKYAELFALSHHFSSLHVDFADGVFVSTQTVMPKDLYFLKTSPLVLTAHFMALHPEKYLRDAAAAGFKRAIIHFEAFGQKKQLEENLLFGEHLGLKMGVALNPETRLHEAAVFLKKIRHVMLMGIQPGAQGREFLPETISRIRELRALSKSVIISVDGGIKVGIARQCALAGADILIAGSAILRAEDEETALEALKHDVEIK